MRPLCAHRDDGDRWRRTPDHEQLADVLNGRGVELCANAREHRLARVAIGVEHPHLDEFVR
jgi:hypothetical protein